MVLSADAPKGEDVVSSEWVICSKCGLKYRTRESTCPVPDGVADQARPP